ncbi:MAG: hypothetical protein IJV67_07845 [Clostridia bacterium]|nr:hypothetical protein [Clostridia bacterium]
MEPVNILIIVFAAAIVIGVTVASIVKKRKAIKSGSPACTGCCDCCTRCPSARNKEHTL